MIEVSSELDFCLYFNISYSYFNFYICVLPVDLPGYIWSMVNVVNLHNGEMVMIYRFTYLSPIN